MIRIQVTRGGVNTTVHEFDTDKKAQAFLEDLHKKRIAEYPYGKKIIRLKNTMFKYYGRKFHNADRELSRLSRLTKLIELPPITVKIEKIKW